MTAAGASAQGKEDLVDETGTNLASPRTAGAGPPRTSSSPRNVSWITGGSLVRATWRLSLPMVAAALFHDLFSLVDLFFVGRLGAGAISASNVLQGLFFVGAFRWGRWKAVGRRHVEAQMVSLNGEV